MCTTHGLEWPIYEMSRVMRKPDFCICENKDADQLRGNREADQRLCFHYIDSTIHLLSKSEISSLKPYSVVVQPGSCRTWSETPKTGFLTTRLRLRRRYLLLRVRTYLRLNQLRHARRSRHQHRYSLDVDAWICVSVGCFVGAHVFYALARLLKGLSIVLSPVFALLIVFSWPQVSSGSET